MLKIEERRNGEVVILTLGVDLVGDAVKDLRELFSDHLGRDSSKGVVIDLRNVRHIDSSGLGLIVSLYKTLKESDRKMVLSSITPENVEIFTVTNLRQIISIVENNESAMKLF